MWSVAAALVAGAIGFLLFVSPTAVSPLPPEIDLSSTPEATRRLINAARDAVLRSPGSANSWGQFGMILLAHELDTDAIPCLQQAVILAPQEFRWHYFLGLATTAVDRRLAISSFRKACERKPTEAIAHARLGELLLADGDVEGAARHLEQAVQNIINPDPRPLQALARVRLLQNRINDAKELAEQATALAPDSRMAIDVLAQALDRLGEKDSVKSLLRRLHSLPDRPLPWMDPYAEQAIAMRSDAVDLKEEAIRLTDNGDADRAARILSAALERTPQDTSLRLTLSQVYLRSRRSDEALRVLTAALSTSPHDAEIWFQIGIVRYIREEFPMAVEAFREVIRLKPDHALARNNLGHCFLKLNDSTAAMDAFQRTLQMTPENDHARINLARLLIQDKQPEAAREHLRKVLQHSPENDEAREMLQQLSAD